MNTRARSGAVLYTKLLCLEVRDGAVYFEIGAGGGDEALSGYLALPLFFEAYGAAGSLFGDINQPKGGSVTRLPRVRRRA